MRILLDANLIITYLSRRVDKFLDEIDQVICLCREQKVDGYVAVQSLAIAWYVLRKVPADLRRDGLRDLCEFLQIAGANTEEVRQAIENNDFPDFEDNRGNCKTLIPTAFAAPHDGFIAQALRGRPRLACAFRPRLRHFGGWAVVLQLSRPPECCARSVHADYIVTANVKDFSGYSRVVPITPADLLDILDLQALFQNPPTDEVHEEAALFFPHGVLVTEQIRLPNHTPLHRHRWQCA